MCRSTSPQCCVVLRVSFSPLLWTSEQLQVPKRARNFKMEQQYNPDTAQIYHFRYMREYRAVCVLWAVLTIIWATFNVVIFVQPQWIGDTPESPGYGHHGVYKNCYPDNVQLRYTCDGSFTDFNSLINDSYKATTFFTGVSALLMLISVAALLLFFCFKKTAVFILVGILELVTGRGMHFFGC